ncbi:hypothetical protein BGW80DRAFT_1252061 [Lactifluus volemus]|nr:hypothetical protein BGW80DRAFT_1252061 [Lactifluus volemus]
MHDLPSSKLGSVGDLTGQTCFLLCYVNEWEKFSKGLMRQTPIGSGAIAQVCRVILKVDLLPPSYFDPKRTRRKGTGALAPVILPESKPSVSAATVAIKGFGRMMYGQLGLSQNPIISSLSYRFQTAIPLELLLKNGGGPYDDQLAELGLDAFLNMLLLDNFVHSDLHPGNIMVKLSRPTTSLLLKTLWTLFTGDVENLANDPTNLESNAVVFGAQISFVFPHRTSFRCLHNEGYLPDLVFIDASLVTTLNAKNRQNFSAPSPSLTAIAALSILRRPGREMTTQENLTNLPSRHFASLLKHVSICILISTYSHLWVVLEARESASAALVNADDLISYDLSCSGVAKPKGRNQRFGGVCKKDLMDCGTKRPTGWVARMFEWL